MMILCKELLLISLLILGNFCYGADENVQQASNTTTDVEVKYRKYEKFNLSDLVINGKLMVPGDLSVEELGEVDLRRKLFEKPHFKIERFRDLTNI